MKNAILAIVTLAVLGCQAQYKTMLHARITPTNSVVVDIPAWAKSDTPPGGGGGGGGTTNYNDLTNKPSINGVTLEGDKSASELNVVGIDRNGRSEIPTSLVVGANRSAGESRITALADSVDGRSAFDFWHHGGVDELSVGTRTPILQAYAYGGLGWLSVFGGFLKVTHESTSDEYVRKVSFFDDKVKISLDGDDNDSFNMSIGNIENVEDTILGKRDKTDNIVAADSVVTSGWKFTCDVPEIQAALDASNAYVEYDDFAWLYFLRGAPDNVGDYTLVNPSTDGGPGDTQVIFWGSYYNESLEEYVDVTATSKKITIAKTGESYVSPVYVTNAINEATADHVKSNDLQLAVAPINNNVNTMWSYIYGENVWIAVTNYMRTIGGVAPSFQLWEKRDGQTNLVYWSAEEIDTRVGDKIEVAMSNIVDSVVTAKADRAWSKYQSMTGADNPQPNDVTIVSTPSVMLSGGYEWQRFVDTGAEVWVLKCNDLITLGADTNAYFRITDLEGETQFAIEKTASRLVDAVPTATGFTNDGNNYFKVTFSGNIQPTIYVSFDLVNSPFIECSATENDYGLSCTWEHDTAANTYTATIAYNAGDGKPPRMFVYGKVLQEGSTVVKHTAPSSFDGGIIINDVQYSVGTATIDGNTVMTLNPVTRAVNE